MRFLFENLITTIYICTENYRRLGVYMGRRMEISLSKHSVARLLEGKVAYEILTSRAYKFKVGCTYKVYSIDDTYIKVLSSELKYPYELDGSKFGIYNQKALEEFVDKRCGDGTWLLNSRVFFLRLENCVIPHCKVSLTGKSIRKTHIKSMEDVGMFVSKGADFSVGSVIAASEPYCELCDRLGDEYMDLLCKEYNVGRDELFTINGWTNRAYVRGYLMPRKVKIVASKIVRVKDITEEEWAMLGVGQDLDSRTRFMGVDYWRWNKYVKLYKFEKVEENGKEEN
jgi:hypothetical protein